MKLTVIPDSQIAVDLGEGDTVTWRIGADAPKPSIHPLTISGQPLTLASPHDHVHHRGAMFALKVDGVNYWEEGDGADIGRQEVTGVRDVACDAARASFALDIDWVAGPRRALQLKESRTFAVERSIADGILMTWTSTLTPAPGLSGINPGVELSGDTPHSAISYYGLGVRFQRAMDIGGLHRNATGGSGVDGTHGTRASWHEYSARLDETGLAVGMAVFDHPHNPRHPTEWFTMQQPFAYVSASAVATAPLRLHSNETLTFTYGLWAHPSLVEVEQVNAVYRDWSSRVSPASM